MMKPNFTPDEYSTVCPYLMVDDLTGQLNFLRKVFSAGVKEEMENEEGVMFHAEVIIGEVVIILA